MFNINLGISVIIQEIKFLMTSLKLRGKLLNEGKLIRKIEDSHLPKYPKNQNI